MPVKNILFCFWYACSMPISMPISMPEYVFNYIFNK